MTTTMKPDPGRSELLRMLTQTTRETDMGRLLRRFWHPVALSKDVANGRAIALKVLGEARWADVARRANIQPE